MWAKKEQLKLAAHDQKWLDNYKNLINEDGYKPSEIIIDETEGVALHFGSDMYLRWTYNNIEKCYDELYGNESEVVNVQSLHELSEARQEGKEFIHSYGLTDLEKDDEAILATLLQYYPELRNLQFGEDSYIINLEIAEGGLRFHKNGGYRGKDCVGESVDESPSDEYLMFSIFKVVK